MFALLYQPFLSYLQFSLYNWLKRSVCSLKRSVCSLDWMKMLKPMDPPPAMVTTSILKRRGDTAALTLLQDTGV